MEGMEQEAHGKLEHILRLSGSLGRVCEHSHEPDADALNALRVGILTARWQEALADA